jgi:hypothetical protein
MNRPNALLATALLVYGALAVTSMRMNSAVIDETAHLPAGYTYPFLFVAAGVAAATFASTRHRRWVVIALCAWYGGSVLRVHPQYLGYFNELAGGPSGGWRYLVDSNLDWGQDLRALKQWMDDHGVAPAVRDASGLRGRIAAPAPWRDQM